MTMLNYQRVYGKHLKGSAVSVDDGFEKHGFFTAMLALPALPVWNFTVCELENEAYVYR